MSVHSGDAKIHYLQKITLLDIHSQSWRLEIDWLPINIDILLLNSLQLLQYYYNASLEDIILQYIAYSN